MTRMGRFHLPWSASIALGAAALTAPAHATVTEPNGWQVPRPLSQDLTCCGNTLENIGLESLFSSRGEAIHWQNDAKTEPAVFSPLCGLHGQLVLRGAGCRMVFGWYNVDPVDAIPPPDSEIYELVTVYNAVSGQFHPRVGEPPVEGVPLNSIRADPRYRGGLIGFAIKPVINDPYGEAPEWVCSQTHYSEPRLNQMSTYGEPWITAVIYQSTVTPNAYYIAFEDLPTTPSEFDAPTPEGYRNDGDFNDFVYFVVGITCEGGGLPCTVPGREGTICEPGVTECLPDGTIYCKELVAAEPETCDGLDNDCNGMADEGDLCPPEHICHKGQCIGRCGTIYTTCTEQEVCSPDGYCVDLACENVSCSAGEVCVEGACRAPCDGVICPKGTACHADRCVDPCENVSCGAGEVCENGACLESCDCRGCLPGKECNLSTGQCTEEGCVSVPCPLGQICENGACVDPCVGAICPPGEACVGGRCSSGCALAQCPPGEICLEEDGQCHDVCETISCAPGYKCDSLLADCVDACADVQCPEGQKCLDGACNGVCMDGYCPIGTRCVDGACVAPCGDITCAPGQICEDGACVERPDGTGATGGSNGSGPGGSAGAAGSSSSGPRAGDAAESPGCGCRLVAPAERRAGALGWALLALGALLLRRRPSPEAEVR